jgi:isoleucyl-tRNA synthetase
MRSHIDKELEKNMEESLEIVVLGRAARNAANIKNRQPMASMTVKADSDLSEYFEAIIREELNVKDMLSSAMTSATSRAIRSSRSSARSDRNTGKHLGAYPEVPCVNGRNKGDVGPEGRRSDQVRS